MTRATDERLTALLAAAEELDEIRKAAWAKVCEVAALKEACGMQFRGIDEAVDWAREELLRRQEAKDLAQVAAAPKKATKRESGGWDYRGYVIIRLEPGCWAVTTANDGRCYTDSHMCHCKDYVDKLLDN